MKAFYWRGIAKFNMQNKKSIVDLNKSLALDASLLQVYNFHLLHVHGNIFFFRFLAHVIKCTQLLS